MYRIDIKQEHVEIESDEELLSDTEEAEKQEAILKISLYQQIKKINQGQILTGPRERKLTPKGEQFRKLCLFKRNAEISAAFDDDCIVGATIEASYQIILEEVAPSLNNCGKSWM